jgi:predicted alpha/beta-hydrolase family hydrolase
MADRLTINVSEGKRVTALAYRAADDGRAGVTLVLAHGAGAGQSSPFMVRFASGLAFRGLDVLTFNFLYTEQRRRVPDRTEKLEACYRAAIEAERSDGPFGRNALFIGGKSMGGRIGSHLAAAETDVAARGIQGLILLGYPLHPPGKPDQLRVAHLTHIRVPMLLIQGFRDPFGTPAELRPVLDRLSAPVTLHVVENGDHSLAPPKRSPLSVDQIYAEVQDAIVQWVKGLVRRP